MLPGMQFLFAVRKPFFSFLPLQNKKTLHFVKGFVICRGGRISAPNIVKAFLPIILRNIPMRADPEWGGVQITKPFFASQKRVFLLLRLQEFHSCRFTIKKPFTS
jgi:hypothetical protein